MECRYILIFLIVLLKYKSFVFEEDHQKGQNISTFHLLLIFLCDFYSFLLANNYDNFEDDLTENYILKDQEISEERVMYNTT